MIDTFENFPLPWHRPEVSELRDLISDVFYRNEKGELEELVRKAGINPARIAWGGTPVMQWYHILNHAAGQGKLVDLLDAVKTEVPTLATRIDEIVGGTATALPLLPLPPEFATPDAAGWSRNFGNERQIVEGQGALLDVAFLALGAERARSICRVTSTFPWLRPARYHGTAAVIGSDLILTNHHVVYDTMGRPAEKIELLFDYEFDIRGGSRQTTTVSCDPITILGDALHDWAVVRTRDPISVRYPALNLAGPTVPPEAGDFVFIIQHPDGREKKVGLSHNVVRAVNADVVQYWTETRAGSSGSPVFNHEWEIVALHHRWVGLPAKNPTEYRNQGVRIEQVRKGLSIAGVAL